MNVDTNLKETTTPLTSAEQEVQNFVVNHLQTLPGNPEINISLPYTRDGIYVIDVRTEERAIVVTYKTDTGFYVDKYKRAPHFENLRTSDMTAEKAGQLCRTYFEGPAWLPE